MSQQPASLVNLWVTQGLFCASGRTQIASPCQSLGSVLELMGVEAFACLGQDCESSEVLLANWAPPARILAPRLFGQLAGPASGLGMRCLKLSGTVGFLFGVSKSKGLKGFLSTRDALVLPLNPQ